jgi:hypothetical protein
MTLEINVEKPAVEECRRLLGPESCEKWGTDGWPDRLVFVGLGFHFWWEFKAAWGELTPAQKIIIPRLIARGDRVYIPRSYNEALGQLYQEIRMHHRRSAVAGVRRREDQERSGSPLPSHEGRADLRPPRRKGGR